MTPTSADLKTTIDALTDWWAGAGVSVDQRQLDQMIKLAQKPAPEPARTESASSSTPSTPTKGSSALNDARALASHATSLETLRDAITRFEGCELKAAATTTVIADGIPDADVMIIGEGPGRDEDIQGLPFVGRAGQLLDKMLASIGLSRQTNAYITNVNFWRPPGNRNPTDEELELCRPFVDKHIALIKPKLIIAAGAVPAKSLLGVSEGITRLRGKKYQLTVPGLDAAVPVFPVLHPAYLLRRPAEKAKAWADLLTISKTLEDMGVAPDTRP